MDGACEVEEGLTVVLLEKVGDETIWGEQDEVVGIGLIDGLERFEPRFETMVVDRAGEVLEKLVPKNCGHGSTAWMIKRATPIEGVG